jgi:hypothetical protein
MPSQSALLGAAGAHFVMCELLRQNLIAALAPEGVPNIDIVVSDRMCNRQCTIQVKTRSGAGSDGGWHMKPHHEDLVVERLFYCFVDFGITAQQPPDVYVMPSSIVADVLKATHKAWLSNPGKNGRQRKDSKVRRLLPDYANAYRPDINCFPRGWLDKYKGAWHLLGLDAAQSSRLTSTPPSAS